MHKERAGLIVSRLTGNMAQRVESETSHRALGDIYSAIDSPLD